MDILIIKAHRHGRRERRLRYQKKDAERPYVKKIRRPRREETRKEILAADL